MSRKEAGAIKARLGKVLRERMNAPATVEMIRRSLAAEVVLDTWLAGRAEENFTPEALALIEEEVQILVERARGKVFPHYPMSPKYLITAFHEFLSSTAMFLANREKGTLEVGEKEAAGAVKRMRDFIGIEAEGINAPIVLYWFVTAYENYGALLYYGRLKQEDFRFGTYHRPWIGYTLDEELTLSVLMGHAEDRQPCPEGMCVRLTSEGRSIYEEIRRILEESGEIAWRLEQQHLALFNELEDYDDLFERLYPGIGKKTQEFIEFADVSPGMTIVEVGCGTGRATLNLGLHKKVLPGGQVIATDHSTNMLIKAENKRKRIGTGNVEFLRASVEDLPFPNDSFDLALGVLVLHFTDAPRAIQEMARVTKPGGTVAVFTAIKSQASQMPVLPIWFEPIFKLANSRGLSAKALGNLPGEVADLMRDAGLEKIESEMHDFTLTATDASSFVRFILQGVGAFHEAMEPLPYAERIRLVKELERTGEGICATTSLEERTLRWQGEFVKGAVPFVPR